MPKSLQTKRRSSNSILLFLLNMIFGANVFGATPEAALVSKMKQRLDSIQNAAEWSKYVANLREGFPSDYKSSSVVVDKLPMEIEGETYTLGVAYRQFFMKADIERVKKILNTPKLWQQLYGLDEPAVESDVAGKTFQARVFKKIPVISDQDYILEYKNQEDESLWLQRATQVEDRKKFALRDNLKALEKVEGGVVFREISLVYILRWYLRALGPQVRSVMHKELTKLNAAVTCAAESELPLTEKLAQECGQKAKDAK